MQEFNFNCLYTDDIEIPYAGLSICGEMIFAYNGSELVVFSTVRVEDFVIVFKLFSLSSFYSIPICQVN